MPNILPTILDELRTFVAEKTTSPMGHFASWLRRNNVEFRQSGLWLVGRFAAEREVLDDCEIDYPAEVVVVRKRGIGDVVDGYEVVLYTHLDDDAILEARRTLKYRNAPSWVGHAVELFASQNRRLTKNEG